MTAPSSKSIGILTSGGDAQGMNAAVRAVVLAWSPLWLAYVVLRWLR